MSTLAASKEAFSVWPEKLVPPKHWIGKIRLEFARRGSRTIIEKREHRGPLVVQQAFYPEGDVCHVYLLHPPGGLVGGDRLEIDVAAKINSHALITTPAATKYYRSSGLRATQTQQIIVGDNACIEWLPQETIFFVGCDACLDTRIELAPTARFINWEILCFGRRALTETFDSGTVKQRIEIWRDGQPLLIDRMVLTGGDKMPSEPWGLSDYASMGTLTAGPADVELVRRVKELAADDREFLFGATLLDDILVVRCLADYSDTVRSALTRVWTTIRPAIVDREVHTPRIWRT